MFSFWSLEFNFVTTSLTNPRLVHSKRKMYIISFSPTIICLHPCHLPHISFHFISLFPSLHYLCHHLPSPCTYPSTVSNSLLSSSQKLLLLLLFSLNNFFPSLNHYREQEVLQVLEILVCSLDCCYCLTNIVFVITIFISSLNCYANKRLWYQKQ